MSIYSGSDNRPDSAAWHAVQVRTLREKAVAQLLSQRGYEYFLPLRQTWNKQTEEKTTTALFPGYLFCLLDLADRRAPVVTTPGVIRLVGPTPVPDEEIESLRSIVNSALAFEGTPFARPGSKVRIMRGPLRGVVGYLDSVKSDTRLVVQITLLQRAVSVEVDRSSAMPCHELEDYSTPLLSSAAAAGRP